VAKKDAFSGQSSFLVKVSRSSVVRDIILLRHLSEAKYKQYVYIEKVLDQESNVDSGSDL
jgi:hypothetical protein